MKLIGCLLIFFSVHVGAITLNELAKDNERFKMGRDIPALVPGYMVFNGQVDDESAVWSLDLETFTKTKLLDGYVSSPTLSPTFIDLGQYAFFILSSNESSKQLWKTDGTVNGTLLVAEASGSSKFGLNNGIIYTLGSGSSLVATDGTTVSINNADLTNLDNICFFDLQNYVSYRNGQLLIVASGQLSAVDFTIKQHNQTGQQVIVSFQDDCFVIDENGEGLWQIKLDGTLELVPINNNEAQESLSLVVADDNSLISLHSDNTGAQFIRRWSSDLSTLLSENTDFSLNDRAVGNITPLGDYVALNTITPTISPESPGLMFLDPIFEVLSNAEGPLFYFFNRNKPRFIKTQTQQYFSLLSRSSDASSNRSLYFGLETGMPNQLISPPGSRNKFLARTDTESAYLFSNNIKMSQVFEVANKPNIGSILTGGWFDTELKNQGLNIRKGTRQDGSEYVTITGYTFRDGKPLWFAGDSELSTPTASLNVALFEFSGIGLFEANNRPDLVPFGSLELNMTGCDKLNASITAENQTFDLNMSRLDDVTYTQNCFD